LLCIFACTIDDVWTWNTFLLYSYPVSNVVSYGLGFRLECAGYQELLRCRGLKLFTVTSMFKPIIDQIMWGPVHWAYKFWDTLESGLWGSANKWPWRGEKVFGRCQSEPAAMTAPVGRSVQRMGHVSSFSSCNCVNQTLEHSQTFSASDPWLLF
jgi:hypothetical protein